MTYKLIKIHGVALFLLTMATDVQANITLIKDMVHFDQAYIPVLAFSSVEEVNASRASMIVLENAWRDFKSKYYLNPGNDKLWATDFNKIDGYVLAGKEIIMRGTHLKDAHEELEHVRIIMMHLRERNNIEYYIDHLTRFHEPMEQIVLAVKGKTAATLDDKTVSLIKNTLPEARQRWHSVLSSKFDASLYEFNKTRAEMLGTLVKKEEVALENLQKAITANDKAQIIGAGLAIKPNFAKLFMAFGHFPKQQ